ncbi:hypothetical protein BCR41DRAFT_411395 [Lobosporangium transversale]|uniref:Uncharacterized protein n=1 Tax=Lobosporangium transversale TaxID=64571 RepID=A0A1Y2GGC4_9FUNG|nr:hypothetical protein BCR41DRAFT_411395 [Lobosporangium transversale]ORZ08278.1 hypothetical protein BCR41DRAFT_411395 [Lobosporangium transversale]|eukprot:XP_021878361.1 hypothetical protein BCR41DRAFT_411395 [Lobosporangium transversale]
MFPSHFQFINSRALRLKLSFSFLLVRFTLSDSLASFLRFSLLPVSVRNLPHPYRSSAPIRTIRHSNHSALEPLDTRAIRHSNHSNYSTIRVIRIDPFETNRSTAANLSQAVVQLPPSLSIASIGPIQTAHGALEEAIAFPVTVMRIVGLLSGRRCILDGLRMFIMGSSSHIRIFSQGDRNERNERLFVRDKNLDDEEVRFRKQLRLWTTKADMAFQNRPSNAVPMTESPVASQVLRMNSSGNKMTPSFSGSGITSLVCGVGSETGY